MDPTTVRRAMAWGLPALLLLVLIVLFAFVSAGIGLVALGLTLAGGVIVFAGWRKLVGIAIVLVLVTFFAAMLIRILPGDPAVALIPFGSEQQREELREDIGLNKPVFEQYGRWLGDFVTGDFGQYYQSNGPGEPVENRLQDAFPISIQLMLYAQILALVFAIPLGILTAYRSGTRFDKTTNTVAFGLLSLPNFVLAYLLIYWFAVQRDVFPSQGYVYFGDNVSEHFKSMFLPAVSLAVGQIAIYMRLLRSDMIQTLQEDFITMARSKGLTTRRILLRHALRPSSFSLLTVAALNVGTLIGAAVILEVIFQLPGIGLLIFQAINERQYVALQAFVAVIGVAYVLINVVVDLLYTVLDPRIRHARAAA
jgi:peptide/nickel transport system permease protein